MNDYFYIVREKNEMNIPNVDLFYARRLPPRVVPDLGKVISIIKIFCNRLQCNGIH